MKPYYQDGPVTVFQGDCIEVMRELPDESVHAVVTDPPYAIQFMGRSWDTFKAPVILGQISDGDRSKGPLPSGPGSNSRGYADHDGHAFQAWCEVWARECLRVLKPGGHMLAFGGSRTWHRLTVAVEDAGFEIRDSIAWLYGSGFPKSLDVSKAIDKVAPRLEMFAPFAAHYAERRAAIGLTHAEICRIGGFHGAVNHGGASVNWERGYGVPTPDQWPRVAEILDMPFEMWSELIVRAEAERTITGLHRSGLRTGSAGLTAGGDGKDREDEPATDAARRWEGWGTALKPGFEPIVVARKPLVGTVAANVLAHGVGALNIDATRIQSTDSLYRSSSVASPNSSKGHAGWDRPWRAELDTVDAANARTREKSAHADRLGRWPANVVLDESQAAALDQQSGTSTSRIGKPRGAASGDGWGMTATGAEYDDAGGASRFFYTAKADSSERPNVDGVQHPTVKPLDLMQWLVRLVTPPGGVVLEPFAGSGTTVEACLREGFDCIAIEREPSYLPLIMQRIQKPHEQALFP